VDLEGSHLTRVAGSAALGYVVGMPAYIDPASLKDVPLMLKQLADDDFSVRVAGRLAGRIMAKPVAGQREVWFWTITGPCIPMDLQPSSGDAETIEEAKEAFRAKFDRWREWAETLGHDVVWNEAVPRV
jgi:hypothetical protein